MKLPFFLLASLLLCLAFVASTGATYVREPLRLHYAASEPTQVAPSPLGTQQEVTRYRSVLIPRRYGLFRSIRGRRFMSYGSTGGYGRSGAYGAYANPLCDCVDCKCVNCQCGRSN